MRSLNIFRLRLRSLFFRGRVEQELADEFQYHLEREIQTNIALGMTPDDARRRAVTSMEGLEQRKEECRDMRALNLIDNAMQDLRYALRSLGRNPGLPLAYPEPDRIVALTSAWSGGDKSKLVTLPDFRDWHDQSSAFRAMACYRSSQSPVMAATDTEYVRVARVSAEFFEVLAVRPTIGRLFSKEEQRSGDSAAALIGYSYWQNHFAGVYGVTAYAVSQRSNEIGLRMALGASPGNVVRLIIKQGIGVAAVGMTTGIVFSLAVARLMRSLLFEVQPSDPMTFLGVAVLLGLVVLSAAYVPARRASQLDPLSTLRQD